MSRSPVSERAAILKKVLKYIDDGDVQEYGDSLTFGLDYVFDDKSSQAAKEIKRVHLQAVGKRVVARKTSTRGDLSAATADKKIARRLRDLLPDMRIPADKELHIAQSIREAMPEPPTLEALDSKFAHEMVGRLEKVVARAMSLPQMTVSVPPNIGVQMAFEEAHRCYLYGFFMGAAVLCRAVLERALIEGLDPDGKLKQKLQRSQSYTEHLLDKAIDGGIVPGSSKGRYLQVKDAGNDAVHSPEEFQRRWSNKVDELLGHTREIVERLYQSPIRD